MAQGDAAGGPPEPRKRSETTTRGSGGGKHATVTELELAFAQDPQSSAYIPLCEAYLEQGRFMEAMVVCKKGIKAHPEAVEARILLARVYAQQKKLARAIQEMDEVTSAFPSSALAYAARGKLRDESGDKNGAIADLKKAIDLDPKVPEATELLAAKGIEYPEPPPPPPPPPPQPVVPAGWPVTPLGVPMPMQVQPVGADGNPDPLASPQVVLPPGFTAAPGTMPASGVWSMPPGGGVFVQNKPRLEGEEELEALANEAVAVEKPKEGSAKLTIALAAIAVLLLAGIVGWRVKSKHTREGIAEITRTANELTNLDTYGAYKNAARQYERLLDVFDSEHQASLGRLAMVYAILVGEHGDADARKDLDRVLPLAIKHAPDNPATVAAQGLNALYSGDDRPKAAVTAHDIMSSRMAALRESAGVGTVADLTLGIIELEQGNYDRALEILADVKQAQPTNARAKVWYGRAAFRGGRLGAAENAFTDALRTSKDHPAARGERALVRVQRGDLDSASADVLAFDDFAQKAPKEISRRDNAQVEYARSEIFRAAGDEAKAAGAYENAIRLDPKNADFPFGVGRWYLQNGREKEALEPLRKAVKMEGNRRAFQLALAEAETETGELDAATVRIETLSKQSPKDLPIALAKAKLLTKQKKPEAEAFIQEVLGWSNGNFEAHLALGRFYRTIGKKPEAKAALEKAIEGMGNGSQAKQGEVYLEYGLLAKEMDDAPLTESSFKSAREMGNMEASFRLIEVLSPHAGDPGARKDLLAECTRYLGAGASLQFSAQARALCPAK